MTDNDRSDRDVHTEHCCSIHGCKYGDDDCTVAGGAKKQSSPCEECSMDQIDEEEWERELAEATYDDCPHIVAHRRPDGTCMNCEPATPRAEPGITMSVRKPTEAHALALAAAEARIATLLADLGNCEAQRGDAEAREVSLLRNNNAALKGVLVVVAEIQTREKDLQAALERYGVHENGCRRSMAAPGWRDVPCTCGLDAALKGST